MLSFVCFSCSTCFPHFFRPVCLSAWVLSSSCSVFRSYAICLLTNRITFLSLSLYSSSHIFFSFFFSSSSRFSYTTLNANILEKIDIGTEKKRKIMMNARQEKKVPKEFSHTLFLPYIYLCVFSFFFRCSIRTSCMLAITVRENDDDDELLNLMLKSSACQ
jgi:hypothetical protein